MIVFAEILGTVPASGAASGVVQTSSAVPAQVVPVPGGLEWLPWLILVIAWLLVMGAVIGPVVRYREAAKVGR